MADLAGKLNIELQRSGAGLAVSITSSRPVSASRVFVGKGVGETASALPALFSVCSVAQSCACAAACESALDLPQPPEVARARLLLVHGETVREHLWRLLLDWPGFLGEQSDGPAMARVMAAFNRLRGALGENADLFHPGMCNAATDAVSAAECLDELAQIVGELVLGVLPDQWLHQVETAEDLFAWFKAETTLPARLMRETMVRGWAALGCSRAAPLPPLSSRELEVPLGAANADAFVAAPLWGGAPAEASPYSRNRGDAVVTGLSARFGNGLLPRMAAQLVEVAALLQGMRAGLSGAPAAFKPVSASTGDGVGIAQVPAARGLLVHRVAVDSERIKDYRILAPTEWNFHPRGAVARGLAGLELADDETLRRQAGLFVTAVDPCVDFDLAIR